MNPPDKKKKIIIISAVVGVVALLLMLIGVYLFQQREVAPDDSDAAVEPIVTEWKAGDTWKKFENRQETFPIPEGFKQGSVKIESQWGWSAGTPDCMVQMNETHEVTIPGVDQKIVMEDLGNGLDQANCTEIINELKALGYTDAQIGPFTLPHVVDTDDSTWFPQTPKSISTMWDSSKGNLVVNIKFTGMDGPPAEWCDQNTGSRKDDPICNGSHKYRVRVIWSAVEDTPTPTLTPSPTNTPSPTPTLVPEKASLGDFVWNDVNRNGLQETGEAGLSGVVVKLFREGETTELSSTTTDTEGKYSFTNIDAGNYYVTFQLLNGYRFSPKNFGNNKEVDSDANTTNGRTDAIVLAPGQNDMSWDAGMYKLIPNIQIIKSEIADHANAKDYQIVANGANATFHIRVVNTGEVDLSNVVVTDAMAPGCARNISQQDLTSDPVGVLKVGQTVDYTCQSAAVTESFVNVAEVVGKPIDGGDDVTDEDDTYVVLAGTPAIMIRKSEIENHNLATDSQTIEAGGTAKFYITVTNIGAASLKDVVVTDPLVEQCARALTGEGQNLNPAMAVGESQDFECQLANVQGSFVNIATVTGKSVETDQVVTDNDPSAVVVPGAVGVEKSGALTCNADQSAGVAYTIRITNPDNETRVLEITDSLDSKVTADMLPVQSISDGGVFNSSSRQIVWSNVSIAGGQTKTLTYTVNVPGSAFGEHTNTVVVKQDSVEVGRDTHTINVTCLPGTAILGDNTARVIVPVTFIVLGILFYVFKGHIYVAKLISRYKNGGEFIS
jgi:uncharacterized repeat protein (TIGR01451 family)